jgi:hypothetical protein
MTGIECCRLRAAIHTSLAGIGVPAPFSSNAGYNRIVKRRVSATTPKNGASHATTVSPLGRDLSKIAERIASSGIKALNRKEVAREVSERRGGR